MATTPISPQLERISAGSRRGMRLPSAADALRSSSSGGDGNAAAAVRREIPIPEERLVLGPDGRSYDRLAPRGTYVDLLV